MLETKEGRGGLALAIALANLLQCTNVEDNDACGECSNCQKSKQLIHPDIHFSFPVIKANGKKCDERNKEVYGLCNNSNYHGHNYDLEVKVTGEVDQETGYLIDLKVLSDIIKEKIENKFDHKNLNLDIPEFKTTIASTENFCYLIWQILDKELGDELDVQVRLFETPRNYVEYPAT